MDSQKSELVKTQGDTLALWEKFIKNEPLGEHSLADYIIKGWELSKKNNIDPKKMKTPYILTKSELKKIKNDNSLLIQVADPMLKMLAAAIEDTGYFATFTVPPGYIINLVGDNRVITSKKNRFNVLGADRSIKATGVSAVTLAMLEEMPVVLRGAEHYNECWHELTCAAAPIFDQNDKVIASLAVSCQLSDQDVHILALTQTCAEAISLRLRELVLLKNEKRLSSILQSVHNLLPDFVITANTDGSIAYANNSAISYFGLSQDLSNKNLSTLFCDPDFVRVQRLLEKGEGATYELEVLSKTGPENLFCRFIPITAKISELYCMLILISKRTEILNFTKHVSGNYAKYSFDDLKGESAVLKSQIKLAKRAAISCNRILLTGESGTGKELFAQSIHNASPIHAGPFVAISCAAIPRDLIESELFGYVGGAFTGARRNGMIGKMELATDGTLFLDEINSLPLEMQAKLLRVLQQMEIVRIGDTKPTPINAKIIVATNKNLQTEVELGNFREDLYFRLNAIEIVIAPLRERKEDIGLLARIFLRRQSLETNRRFKHVSAEALNALYNYQWPGNVRELDNVCERALLWSEDGIITLKHLPPHISGSRSMRPSEPLNYESTQAQGCQYTDILSALELHKGNISKAAVELGVARCTLYRHMKKYDIQV